MKSRRRVNSTVMFLSPPKVRTLLLKLVICGSVLLFAQSAFGCLCQGGSPKKAFDRARKKATVIFVGRAVAVHNGTTHGEFAGWRVKLTVEQYWKGKVTEEIVVFTGPDDCAAYFEVGREYLILGYVPSGDDHLYTDVCMKTGLVLYSANDLKRLGRGRKPIASP
jgi:hypothetical protein